MTDTGTFGIDAVVDKLRRRAGASPKMMVLAHRCGLRLHPRDRLGTRLSGCHLYFDATETVAEQRRSIAIAVVRHELRAQKRPASPTLVHEISRRLIDALYASNGCTDENGGATAAIA